MPSFFSSFTAIACPLRMPIQNRRECLTEIVNAGERQSWHQIRANGKPSPEKALPARQRQVWQSRMACPGAGVPGSWPLARQPELRLDGDQVWTVPPALGRVPAAEAQSNCDQALDRKSGMAAGHGFEGSRKYRG